MDLRKLFEMQKTLDDRIIREHVLEEKPLTDNKILALLVELGETANEWQLFKHWKVNPHPSPKLLEEFVDCLHFILSLGNERDALKEDIESLKTLKFPNAIAQFNYLFEKVGDFNAYRTIGNYQSIWKTFLGLSELLGFTWEQIEQAYMEKNKVNHERQDNGY